MTAHVLLVCCIMFIFFGSCWTYSINSVLSSISEDTLAEDGKLNFTQLASKYGHCAEQHEVVTEDGYILTIFSLGDKDGPSVLLFHGLTDCSDTFIIRGNTSLAITLANAGYNVWVANNRGNKFGRRHVTLEPDTDKKFFDYSFHEIGYFDLPATLDYICDKTGEESIATIGHSQGNAVHYVLGSTRPEYNRRIKILISLAPAVLLSNLIFPLSLVAYASPVIDPLIESLGSQELFQNYKTVSDLFKLICSKGLLSYVVCGYGLVFPISGFNPSNTESEFLRVIFGHYPSGTSKKTILHYGQTFSRKRFCKYDHGLQGNIVKYGTACPPDYDLSAVKMKIALLVGKNDQLAGIDDAKYVKENLPNVVHYEILEPKLWTHSDFVWGKDMPKHLYPSLFKILKKYI